MRYAASRALPVQSEPSKLSEGRKEVPHDPVYFVMMARQSSIAAG
ncbi:hypothetical protein RGAI101_170 [Roseobacter sp. GAI101]|nr:hypothetical protein RGAI101_170 [Roseobacter sp. GAI101]